LRTLRWKEAIRNFLVSLPAEAIEVWFTHGCRMDPKCLLEETVHLLHRLQDVARELATALR
jgi:hypothetical protein